MLRLRFMWGFSFRCASVVLLIGAKHDVQDHRPLQSVGQLRVCAFTRPMLCPVRRGTTHHTTVLWIPTPRQRAPMAFCAAPTLSELDSNTPMVWIAGP